MAESLTDTNVAVFLAQRGTEEVEFTEPKGAVEDAGASTDVVGAETGEVQTVNNDLDPGDTFEVEKTFSEVSPEDYDALVVPGGSVGADQLRADGDAVDLVREFIEAGKPAGVICHGPWMLVEADVVEGRTLTSFPSLQTDIRNAGGEWVNEEVVVDEGLVTSRKPDDLDAFCDKIIEEFEEGRH
ncbi:MULTISPECIES: type 1 glutamine amidotransferase domain-containing protein [Halobacteriales]|uniref:Intracellular protease, PfpI family protein n=1 Tax=Halalkalicoccus jeotgali (strain DSM 18796 / CECT 7217 / JCM 14584 / KCTC 4019 / B3) TaxID=795797 RepID=D8JC07_HALJB|nr:MULTISPECIES: type 1 glutamine amidotransferase domain-containing protein [Halobacteria]ADJ16914.1 intracellular protease, PfpI family protein [Halalkalicoccus jeotgali B3]ELY38649.1 intracellular protease, PfpI family protein [Halalkalicoccus jeotgali B3]